MAGTAQAAERIRCDRCSGHYVVDAASDGSPRVRCNKCGHLREVAEPSPASVPGKWTVIGPDGKALSFDTWEELTESRRPSAITPTARGMEEANEALRDLKPAAAQEKKSASALLDITPAPKLALADMDSAIDLGEPLGGSRKSRPGSTTMMSGSGTGSVPSGKLEPLLVRSFSQAPKTQTSPKVEWAPKIDKSIVPPRGDHDNTLRVEVAPAALAESKPSGQEKVVAPAPATTKVMEAERPTAPRGGVAADDSIDELDPDSLLDDAEEEDAAPLSLRDAIPEDASSEEELGDADLHEDAPDPHELLSLRDLVVVPAAGADDESKPDVAAKVSNPPPAAKPSQAPPPKLSQAPKPAPATSQAPPAKSLPPRPKSLSRPDVPEGSLPPPTIRPPSIRPPAAQEEKAAEASTRRASARAATKPEEKPNRTWMYAVGALLALGVGWRLMQSSDTPPPPPPAPTPTVATVVPPTPVTAPTTNEATEPTPTATESTAAATDVPPTTSATGAAPGTPSTASTVATTAAATAKPATAANPTENTGTTAPAAAPKPAVANTDTPGSMSELLDKAGSAKRKGDHATARELYGRVIAMNPANVEANGGLGDVAKSQGDLGAAKASYERALAASPTYSPALLGLADVEWDQGNQASAKKRYAQIVDRLGDRAPARAKERSQ